MDSIKNIIFDYGGVIIDLDYERTKKAFEKLGVEDFDNHFTQLNQTPLFNDFDKGKITNADFRRRLNQQLKKNLSDNEIDTAWNAMLNGIRKEKLITLQGARKHHRTFLLSNTNFIHLKSISDYLSRTYGVKSPDAWFDGVYYSCEMGLRKPDAEIFLKVLEENVLNPAETLFIDDGPQHIEGAKKVGLQTVLYDTSKKLGEVISSVID